MMKDMESLLVVFAKKHEEVFEHLKELIMTEDDLDGEIIGTEDGTIKVLKCYEESWKQHHRLGQRRKLGKKTVILGNMKDVEPPIEFLFKAYGVGYGIAEDNYMQIYIDDKFEWSRDIYDEFIMELNELVSHSITQMDALAAMENVKNKNTKKAMVATGVVLFPPLALAGVAKHTYDITKEKELIRKQQLMYAVTKLYYDDLEAYMKEED